MYLSQVCRRCAPAASPERHSYAQCRCKEQAKMRRRDGGAAHSVESKLRRCAFKHVLYARPAADERSATPSRRSSCETVLHQPRARFWHAQSAASHHRCAGLHRNASRARVGDDSRNAVRRPMRWGARAHRMQLAQPLHLVPPSDQRGSAASALRGTCRSTRSGQRRPPNSVIDCVRGTPFLFPAPHCR